MKQKILPKEIRAASQLTTVSDSSPKYTKTVYV